MTDRLRIIGGVPLCGTVTASGSKNAALPIMAAALLADEPVVLDRVPQLSDVPRWPKSSPYSAWTWTISAADGCDWPP